LELIPTTSTIEVFLVFAPRAKTFYYYLEARTTVEGASDARLQISGRNSSLYSRIYGSFVFCETIARIFINVVQ